MKTYVFRAIDLVDIPVMAKLLLCRQTAESKVFPFLENNCLHTDYIIESLKELFLNNKVIGIGAFDSDELLGYMIGIMKINTVRGKHMWVPYEGVVIRDGQPFELIRNLYAKVAIRWLEQGCFSHYVIIPLGVPTYYDEFLRLSFGIQQVHGIMNLFNYRPFEQVSEIRIRPATVMDREAMGKMSGIISSHQNLSPVFEPFLPEFMNEIKEGYQRILEDNNVMVFMAEQDDKELGFHVYEPINSGLMSPENGVELSIAGVYSSLRGEGIGKKLMNEGCRFMKEKGYNYITADWRITNLSSSTFWPKCGFKQIAYRMVRHIQEISKS